MTNETIAYIIDLINAGKASDVVFLRPLAPKVLFGHVWIKNEKGDIYTGNGWKMFFIRNKVDTVVAAVVDMGPDDLHVYVLPRYRKKGHLVKALTSVILPYLFATDRKEQRITFQAENALRHAQQVGFHPLSDTTAVITPASLSSNSIPHLGTISPSESQIQRIKGRINLAADLLRMARDDFESAFGEDEVWEGIDYLAREVANEAWTVRDLWQDLKKMKGEMANANTLRAETDFAVRLAEIFPPATKV